MRIALVSMHTTHHEETEAARRLRRTAELLAEHDHKMTVLCAKRWDGEAVGFKQDGVTCHRVTDAPVVGGLTSHVPFTLHETSPDVIQIASYPPWHVVAVRTAARFLRAPVTADWWTRDGHSDLRAYRQAAKSPNTVLVPSEMVHTQVHELDAAVDSTHLVPEPINMDLVRSADADEYADVVYARDLNEHTSVESFLLALTELRGKDRPAVVIGDGPGRSTAEQTARDLRIDNRVEFLGELSVNEAVSIMKGAHVFVQTTMVEPFVTNLLWAFAYGCVSIVECQARSSTHELVERRERGSLVTSPQELADEIVAARRYDHETVDNDFARYDFRRIIEQYESIYEAKRDDYNFL